MHSELNVDLILPCLSNVSTLLSACFMCVGKCWKWLILYTGWPGITHRLMICNDPPPNPPKHSTFTNNVFHHMVPAQLDCLLLVAGPYFSTSVLANVRIHKTQIIIPKQWQSEHTISARVLSVIILQSHWMLLPNEKSPEGVSKRPQKDRLTSIKHNSVQF